MTDLGRVTLAARVFTLAGLVSVAGLLGSRVLPGALAVLVVAFWAQLFSLTGRILPAILVVAEGAVIGILGSAMWPNSDAVTPYLVVPVLIGGLSIGAAGAVWVLLAEAVSMSTTWLALGTALERGVIGQVVLWLVAGFGLGLLGVAYRHVLARAHIGAPYRDALDLIKRLHALSDQLAGGLDAVTLAESIMQAAARELSVVQAMVLVRGPNGTIAPLRFSDGASTDALLQSLPWVTQAWQRAQPVTQGQRLAVPLRADEETVGMLVADCLPEPADRSVERLKSTLEVPSLQLHAALLFGDIRDTATSQERQRLAREVHDGVAQDVASLGYLVDNLADVVSNEAQALMVSQLRRELTRVVAELRHSVFELRNEAGSGQGLGQSLSSFARHIGSHSDFTVHVTLDEAPTRLRPEVESELLRIAQEAINNARKHSGGTNLWVTCTVDPPAACIEVRDDGTGLGRGRDDSHGLRIMRERAERIGADLSVETTADTQRGTRVVVRLPAWVNDSSDRWMVRT